MSKPYCPSNGTEGMAFMEAHCFKCEHDAKYRRTEEGKDGCLILARTMAFDPSDGIGPHKYPSEWIYEDDGAATCTSFKPEHDEEIDGPRPFKHDPRTLNLFEDEPNG